MRRTELKPGTALAVQRLSTTAYAQLWSELDPESRAPTLRARCRTDREHFAHTFFADRFELDWSPVHREFLATPKVGWRERRTPLRRCRVAPRGAAKSTLKSFVEIVHDVVYALEVCVLLFSTGFQLSEDLVKDLHDVFTAPDLAPELHEVYGPFRVRGTQTAFAVFCPGGEALGTQIAAKSFGAAQTRGHKYAGHRPSKVVLDDTVNPKRLKNPEQRDEAWRYLQRDIDKVGARYTLLELVGTIQHADDLVARVSKSPSWQTVTWRNLITWPKRMDRWDECRRLWADLADPDRVATARGFYERNPELNDGAAVLWPEGRGLFELMASWWQDPAAFWAEDQNSPRDLDTCLFDLEKIPRCRFDGLLITTSKGQQIPLHECEIGIWLDPSSGGKGRDFPAIAVVAQHHPRRSPASLRTASSQGYGYVLSVELIRRQPSAQHEALWATWERYITLRPKVGMDETGTQALLGEAMERLQEKRRAQGIAWQMPIRAISLTTDKIARIARLEPRFLHGWLELAEDVPGEVIDQIRDFPNAAFDDALDAIERAEWLLTGDLPTVTRTNMERA